MALSSVGVDRVGDVADGVHVVRLHREANSEAARGEIRVR
jgi:hypothetical protein